MAHRRTAPVPKVVLVGGVLLCTLALGACTMTRTTVTRSGKAIGEGIDEAVTAPLEDLNLMRENIPVALIHAQAEPYSLKGLTRCEAIAGEVGRIDAALGPDLDEPPPPDGRRMNEKGADYAAIAALNAVRDTTTGVIPMRGWVRRLTGAERHEKAVREAIKAGTVRRAYLKGVGMQKNCAPPAAPSWFVPVEPHAAEVSPPPVVADQGGS
ncbi:hypothetical protein [Caulobacter sp. 17J65-9]|uniref:hypothetical protein n=1 Tax=Caulobacter sp. 17J65-9 TaxID=2709382 RepID=UPI0013C8CE1E|nr:hypothetical protein [Caulobacter sp. 17J65-9]NEX94554.1 hypothetical protein [Caulobacter sp. 17J65-9]